MGVEKMLSEYARAVDEYIIGLISAKQDAPEQLRRAMLYSVGAGGKRIRPAIMLEFFRVLGYNPNSIINFAAAVEMIHTYSLIHDDLPCMDDDDMRRGKPSCHIAFGESLALLAGDALLTLAFEAASTAERSIEPAAALRAVSLLASAAGLTKMVGGQVLDLASENRQITLEELERLQDGKTMAMLLVNAQIAAALSGCDEQKSAAMEQYCRCIGRAFQIRDDILDVEGDVQSLGKPIGSDNANHKNTFVSLLGMERSKALVTELTAQAKSAVSIFGAAADNLCELAQMLCERDN